mmetsp:Transcript_88444/g.258518  ORF Transcript_88444/g.258518 Transcript_88444/m.258518 type:complete len:101 (-) Transcript_88444:1323-1625(-)
MGNAPLPPPLKLVLRLSVGLLGMPCQSPDTLWCCGDNQRTASPGSVPGEATLSPVNGAGEWVPAGFVLAGGVHEGSVPFGRTGSALLGCVILAMKTSTGS